MKRASGQVRIARARTDEQAAQSRTTKKQTALVKDVVQFLGLLATLDAARTSTGQIHRTALKNAARLMSLPEDKYALFVYALCRSANSYHACGRKANLYADQNRRPVFTARFGGTVAHSLSGVARQRTLGGDGHRTARQRGQLSGYTAIVVSIRDAALETIRAATGDGFYYHRFRNRCHGLADAPDFGVTMRSGSMSCLRLPHSCAISLRNRCIGWEFWNSANPKAGQNPRRRVTMRINRAFRTEEVTKACPASIPPHSA